MKFLTIIFIAAATLATAGHAENFKRIKTEAEFRKFVVDKKLTSEGIWMTVQSDGKTKGFMFEKTFAAAWIWKNRMYCRNAVLGKNSSARIARW